MAGRAGKGIERSDREYAMMTLSEEDGKLFSSLPVPDAGDDVKLTDSPDILDRKNVQGKAPGRKRSSTKQAKKAGRDQTDSKYTLKVYPQGLGRQVYRVMEISGSESLDRLCREILDSFAFTMEHLYEFCMDNKAYSDEAYQSDPEYPGDLSTKVQISSLGLVRGQKFTLHYDFGDDWMFAITVQKIEEAPAPVPCRVIKEKGAIEQYPDWDEEWDE